MWSTLTLSLCVLTVALTVALALESTVKFELVSAPANHGEQDVPFLRNVTWKEIAMHLKTATKRSKQANRSSRRDMSNQSCQ